MSETSIVSASYARDAPKLPGAYTPPMGVRLDVFAGDEPDVRAVLRDVTEPWASLRALRSDTRGLEHVVCGERRWWVPCLATWARTSRLFPPDDLVELERALALLIARSTGPSDCHVAFWDATTTTRVADAASLLCASGIVVPARPSDIGIAPDAEEWPGWVRDLTERLVKLHGRSVIAFCG
jgi:hypothetical protein